MSEIASTQNNATKVVSGIVEKKVPPPPPPTPRRRGKTVVRASAQTLHTPLLIKETQKENTMSDINTTNIPGANVPQPAVTTPASSAATTVAPVPSELIAMFKTMMTAAMTEVVKEARQEVTTVETKVVADTKQVVKEVEQEAEEIVKEVLPKNPCSGWFGIVSHDWIYLEPSKEQAATIDQLLTFGQAVMNPKNGPRKQDLMHRVCRKCFKDENHVTPYIAALKKARGVA